MWRVARKKNSEKTPQSCRGWPGKHFVQAPVQRERITSADVEAFGSTAGCPGCNGIRSGKRAQAHPDPCRVRFEECLKTTSEGAECPDQRSRVLNEALAKEVERNVRRREEIGSAAGELACTTGVERYANHTRLRSEKETCNESSDSSCDQ